MKHAFTQFLIFFVIVLSGCSTSSVYIDPLAANYKTIPITAPSYQLFGKREIGYSNYTLKLVKPILQTADVPDSDNTQKYKSAEGGLYSFQSNGTEKYTVEIIKKSKMYADLHLFKFVSSIKVYSQNKLILNLPIESFGSDLFLKSEELIPIMITENKYSYQNGKKHELAGFSIAGLNIIYDGREYGIINLLDNPAFIMNTDFSGTLSEEESQLLALIILSSFEYCMFVN